MAIKVKRDSSNLAKMVNSLQKIGKQKAEVGWFEDQGHPETDLSLGALANILEEGTEDTVPRPFIHLANELAIKEAERVARRLRKKLRNGEITEADFLRAKAQVHKDTLEMVMNNSLSYGVAPNTASTIRRKGGNTPLIETGYLAANIDIRIKDK